MTSPKPLRAAWEAVVALSPMRLFWLIFGIGFIVRILGVIAIKQYLDLERYELERIAISLANTGVFGNPYALPTGPSAHVSPGYPIVLAAIFKIFGTSIPGEIVKQVFACATTAFQCAVIPAVARALSIDWRAGLLAAFFSALIPFKFHTQTMGDWETPYVALILMLLSVLTVRLWKQQDFSFRNAIIGGLAWGISLLWVSAVMSLFFAFLVLGFFFVRRGGRVRYLRFCAIEAVLIALCLAPWAIRNYYALGAPLLSRSNPGLELRISNNDIAGPNEHFNFLNGVYHVYHPLQNPKEALKVREMGEVAYNKAAMDDARQWIRTHPKQFLLLTLGRIRWFWFYTDSEHLVKSLYLYTASFVGFLGLIYIFRVEPVTGAVLAAVLLIFPLPNYLVHVGLRHKYPIDWIMTLLTAAILVRGWDLFRKSHVSANQPPTRLEPVSDR